MAGQPEIMMGREGEACWSPYRPPSGSEVRTRKNSKCFHCKKQGHWAKECPTKTPGRSPLSFDREVRPWVCRCSEGTCVVVTISGVKQYRCPGRKADGEKCGFQMPCELAVFDDNGMPRPPICTCEAGFTRICTMSEGPNAGRPYYGCSIKKGEGACSFLKWCDEHKEVSRQYDGATQSMNSGHDERGSAIPLVDDVEELGEDEMQIFQDACKRKCDEMNQAGCSFEQKKLKMAMPAVVYPRIESDQLTCATQSMNSGHDERGSAIPLVDDVEELGEDEMQIFQDACKRKCDEMNQAGCSFEQKKLKMAMPAVVYPRIESDQLTSPGNVANITDLNQVTPAPNASTGSAEVASPAMDNFPYDAVESNLNVSSPKGGCTRHTAAFFEPLACSFWVCCMRLRFGVTAITRLLNLADPEGKSKGSDPISKVDFTLKGASNMVPNTQRRLEFDEAVCIDSVSDKILALIGTFIRYGSGSKEVTYSPIVAAHSIISLSQSSTVTGGKLFPEEHKISQPLFSSNDSSLLCILGLLKSTPFKDLPNFEDGIRRLISDLNTTSKEAEILNRVLECLLFLGDAYRAKEVSPSFTPAEEEFQHSQAVMKDEIFKITNECSKITTSLREASLHVERCRANGERAQLDVKALEIELVTAQMKAAEMMAREQKAQERLNELEEDSNYMARQLGELVMRRASEDYEHQERVAAFHAADKKRVREMAILEEAGQVVVRMLEGEL